MKHIGQLALYMDGHYARYTFLTIYGDTSFFKRFDDDHFALSPKISAEFKASAAEAFL